MYPLDRIEIKGYKSIREMDLELRPLNILLGANGAGKTNFISAFELLNQIVNTNLQRFVGESGGADALLFFGQKTTDSMTICLYFGKNEYEATLVPAADDTLIFGDEEYRFGGGMLAPLSLGSGHKESELGPLKNLSLKDLKSWRIYHFHDTSETAKVKKVVDLNDNAELRPDASNLAAFLYYLREMRRDYYDSIVRTIRLAAPFFDDFNLHPDRLNPDKIRLEWREVGSDAYFNASSLSDGTLRFMSLATLLLQPDLPATILIDEPELGLHPYAIVLLADMLRSATTRAQVIVSMQSVPLVNQFSPEDVIVVDREDGQSVFRRLDQENLAGWLDDYGLGDLWEKNVIGGRPQG